MPWEEWGGAGQGYRLVSYSVLSVWTYDYNPKQHCTLPLGGPALSSYMTHMEGGEG